MKRQGPCRYGFVVLAALAGARVGDAQQRSATIVIDGISGATCDTAGAWTNRSLRPGDSAVVIIRPANLLYFSYTVRLANVEELHRTIPVIGATGEVVKRQAAATEEHFPIDTALALAGRTRLPTLDAMVDRLDAWDAKLLTLQQEGAAALGHLREANAALEASAWRSCATNWPPLMTDAKERFRTARRGILDSLLPIAVGVSQLQSDYAILKLRGKLPTGGAAVARAPGGGPTTRQPPAGGAPGRGTIPSVESLPDEPPATPARPVTSGAAAADDLAGRVETAATLLADRAKRLREDLDRGAALVDRWDIIRRQAEQGAEVRQAFLVDQVSKRYTLEVLRTPFAAAPADGVPAPGAAPARPTGDAEKGKAGGSGKAGAPPAADRPPGAQVIRTITFEGHAPSRFAVAVGMAGVFRNDARTYALVPRVGPGSDTLTFTLEETGASRFVVEPVAMLGIYTTPVDDLDPKRPWGTLMLNIGSHLKLNPDFFLAGAALDIKWGMLVGAGVTTYEARRLVGGYSVGQQIPARAGKSVLEGAPTRTTTRVGPYVTLSFRPAIFRALRDLLKL